MVDEKEVFRHKIKVAEDMLMSGVLDNNKELKDEYLKHLNKLYEICKEAEINQKEIA